jgi:D-apionolactonase
MATSLPTRWELLRGRPEPPPQDTELAARQVRAGLDGPDLRYVTIRGSEQLRRLYVAVRDADWNTIPGTFTEFRVTEAGDRFQVSFEGTHQRGPVDFRWEGRITLESGALTYEMRGTAHTAFAYNRVGCCVLHPPQHAGRPYRARTPEGEVSGRLPDLIAPQRIEDGALQPVFPSFSELRLPAWGGEPGVRFVFEGDLFETEDQRNWTDASFKTYSTPISLGVPWQAVAGQPFGQRVTMHVEQA